MTNQFFTKKLALKLALASLLLFTFSFAEDITLPEVNFEIPEGFVASSFLSEEQEQAFEEAEEVLEENTDYAALIITNKGAMFADLYEQEVPNTVNNFVFLSRHKYYDDIVFHRVIEDFMAQTGDPTGTGTGGPGYQFADEFVDTLKHEEKGTLSMANSGPDTNGSQFFMTFVPTPHLDGRHSIFGKITEGVEVLDDIERISPNEPSAVVNNDDTLETLAEKGVTLKGDSSQTIDEYLEKTLGAVPSIGQTFDIDGVTAVAGRIGETPAYGFYAQPDFIEHIYILERPQN